MIILTPHWSPGLDRITALAQKLGAFGSRLTGAGWGGCMVALVAEAGAEAFISAVRAEYYGDIKGAAEDIKGAAEDIKGAAEAKRLDSAIFVTKPGPGASIMEIV